MIDKLMRTLVQVGVVIVVYGVFARATKYDGAGMNVAGLMLTICVALMVAWTVWRVVSERP